MFYLVIIFVVMLISAIIFYPIFYFIPIEKRKRCNQFLLVVLILSFLTILVISPFMVIVQLQLLLILSIIVSSVSWIGYLYSKTKPET
ncbi:hypothetical protein AN959_09220 [Psychrobacillus sp. FJAT-21963]|nr:hypothetical protein AN959_09220 [Psychrobacillus sp. FJAT-21963]